LHWKADKSYAAYDCLVPTSESSPTNPTAIHKFFLDRSRGESLEDKIVLALSRWGIEAGRNPYSGTEDSRRGDYDVWFVLGTSTYTIEAKLDSMAHKTGNFCIELEATAHSKASLFVYGLPAAKLYLHAFTKSELEGLIGATTYRPGQGRLLLYRRIRIGDQPDNLGIVPPLSLLQSVGRPFGQAIRDLIRLEAQSIKQKAA
jgi:hypothetical protein